MKIHIKSSIQKISRILKRKEKGNTHTHTKKLNQFVHRKLARLSSSACENKSKT